MTSDKLSIKNLLFTKALPNYIAPNLSGRHKVYSCTDCGDKYMFESSYSTHINRKSVKITYICRHCGQIKLFLNRCNLLSHIRSHSFKTATINVGDLKIEPLPIDYYNIPPKLNTINQVKNSHTSNTQLNVTSINVMKNVNIGEKSKHTYHCIECKEDINITGIVYKDRTKHYMQVSNNITCYSCPICLYSLPTSCALKSHLRIHLGKPPFYCPECGIHISNKCVMYPYNHDCEGFRTIRATTRLKCTIKDCTNFHPNDLREHMKDHIVKVFKCSTCFSTWSDKPPKHKLPVCNNKNIEIESYKCPLCPDKLFSKARIENHMNSHYRNILNCQVFPCRLCNKVYDHVQRLLYHHIQKHSASKIIIGSLIPTKMPKKGLFRVVKRCDKCLRSFTYRCPFDKIKILPSECPYNCSKKSRPQIKCFVCKVLINADWKEIKKHFSLYHSEHKCVDVEVNLQRLLSNKKTSTINNKEKDLKQTRYKTNSLRTSTSMNRRYVADNTNTIENKTQVSIICSNCGLCFNNEKELEDHIVSHRDLQMAYQCFECTQCFAVKPSFSTHLLLEHHISDVEEYISKKKCFNELAFVKNQPRTNIDNEPLEKNQCKICREKFNDNNSLEKHFRVHGMAFLMENTLKNGTFVL